jgi:hypothetical protein
MTMICALALTTPTLALGLLAAVLRIIRYRQRPGRHRPGSNPRVGFDLITPRRVRRVRSFR